jgi:hypothetical protein
LLICFYAIDAPTLFCCASTLCALQLALSAVPAAAAAAVVLFCSVQVGEANDYVGKGMAGGEIVIVPPADAGFVAEDASIAGNTCLYGATGERVGLMQCVCGFVLFSELQ